MTNMSHNEKNENPTVIGAAVRRDLARTSRDAAELSDFDKSEILRGLISGTGITTILKDLPGAPGFGAVIRARRHDAAFDAAYAEARAAGAEVLIDEALDYSFGARADKQLSTAAHRYADTILKSAEKLAPKQYGPLLKLAGHDGNALSINVVTFQEKPQQLIDVTAETVEPDKA